MLFFTICGVKNMNLKLVCMYVHYFFNSESLLLNSMILIEMIRKGEDLGVTLNTSSSVFRVNQGINLSGAHFVCLAIKNKLVPKL